MKSLLSSTFVYDNGRFIADGIVKIGYWTQLFNIYDIDNYRSKQRKLLLSGAETFCHICRKCTTANKHYALDFGHTPIYIHVDCHKTIQNIIDNNVLTGIVLTNLSNNLVTSLKVYQSDINCKYIFVNNGVNIELWYIELIKPIFVKSRLNLYDMLSTNLPVLLKSSDTKYLFKSCIECTSICRYVSPCKKNKLLH